MSAYRVYETDGAGRFSKADWIEADSDDAALAAAKARVRSTTYEVWHGSRLVGKNDGKGR